jgi:hypothetical protein
MAKPVNSQQVVTDMFLRAFSSENGKNVAPKPGNSTLLEAEKAVHEEISVASNWRGEQ